MTSDRISEGSQMSMLDGDRMRHFNGPEYQPKRDHTRLTGQIADVYAFMRDGAWHTLDSIATGTGHPHASVSAQLRHLRKPRFGGHIVERRHISNGLFEYCLGAK